MNPSIIKYLNKRGIQGNWNLNPHPALSGYSCGIVIPACCERDWLPATLDCLAFQDGNLLKETLVTVVINNSSDASESVRQENRETAELILDGTFNFYLTVVDAFSAGRSLPPRHAGVGKARKIGMDLTLPHLIPGGFFCCLDADTLCEPEYLETVFTFFQNKSNAAAVVNFHHQLPENPRLIPHIETYEHFLKSTAVRIRQCGSPYGYPSVGSTIIVRSDAYAAVGGMPAEKAGEDFYFLQAAAKYTEVKLIERVLVHPSSRISERVHLGTGTRLKQALDGFRLDQLYYSDRAFAVLKIWLELGLSSWNKPAESLLEDCMKLDANLVPFLERHKIRQSWKGLCRSAPSEQHFQKQFHRWFDAFKTMRLLKYFS